MNFPLCMDIHALYIRSMILQNLQGKEIILASKSPRRQQLIKGLGIDINIQTREVDESFDENELKRERVARFLAEKKADAFSAELREDQIVITGDTTVYLDGVILNKPEDREDALRMLGMLSGKTHTVITGVCILSTSKKIVLHDETDVTFGDLTQEEMEYYVDVYKPFDKAGSYGAQDFIGFIGIQDMKGSFYNVMGFPLHKIYAALKTF